MSVSNRIKRHSHDSKNKIIPCKIQIHSLAMCSLLAPWQWHHHHRLANANTYCVINAILSSINKIKCNHVKLWAIRIIIRGGSNDCRHHPETIFNVFNSWFGVYRLPAISKSIHWYIVVLYAETRNQMIWNNEKKNLIWFSWAQRANCCAVVSAVIFNEFDFSMGRFSSYRLAYMERVGVIALQANEILSLFR